MATLIFWVNYWAACRTMARLETMVKPYCHTNKCKFKGVIMDISIGFCLGIMTSCLFLLYKLDSGVWSLEVNKLYRKTGTSKTTFITLLWGISDE